MPHFSINSIESHPREIYRPLKSFCFLVLVVLVVLPPTCKMRIPSQSGLGCLLRKHFHADQ